MSEKFQLGDYVDVAQRIREFKAAYPDGRLRPADPAVPYRIETIGDRTFVVYVAAALRDAADLTPGVGSAWEPFPGRTPYTRDSELQNAETSAWGRAIVAALVADTQKIASADEVRNRNADQESQPPVDERAVIRGKIATVAKAKGLTLGGVAAEFESRYACPIGDGNIEQLHSFLHTLTTGEVSS